MQIPPKQPTPIAKLILCQPLADHDGAAIFAVEIITFEKQTGVLLKRVTLFPSLELQLDAERSIDMNTLYDVIQGNTAQNYLNTARAEVGVPTAIQSIIPILTEELFKPHTDCDLFWWNAVRSYPVLRAFYVQNNEDVNTNFELDPVIDVRSFIGTKRIGKLDDNDQVYTVLNWIAQRFMPTQNPTKVGTPPDVRVVKGFDHMSEESMQGKNI